MPSSSVKTAHKLGANPKEIAHKSRRARKPSESTDIHEDRGAIQSKFGRADGTTRVRPRPGLSISPPRPTNNIPWEHAAARLLTEHSSGPEFHVVHLRLFKDGARNVSVAGTFNEWKPGQTPLQQCGASQWETILSLAPGDYEYRFVIDGEWADDPLACRHAPNPYGGQNAVLHVHHC